MTFIPKEAYDEACADGMGWCATCRDFTRSMEEWPPMVPTFCPACLLPITRAQHALQAGLIEVLKDKENQQQEST